jgi:hypothetical protein
MPLLPVKGNGFPFRAAWLASQRQVSRADMVEENAALIAEHLEAAGDLHAAYGLSPSI